MRKRLWVSAVLMLMLTPMSGRAPTVQEHANAAALTLQAYTSMEGRFSVMLPGKPRERTERIPLDGGGTSTLHEFWIELDDRNVTYMVLYNDYPVDYGKDGAQAVLETTRDGAAKGKMLTSDAEIDLNGVPGRAFTVTGNDGWSYNVRQFLAGKRLYQLMVVTKKGYAAALTAPFMRSFRIL